MANFNSQLSRNFSSNPWLLTPELPPPARAPFPGAGSPSPPPMAQLAVDRHPPAWARPSAWRRSFWNKLGPRSIPAQARVEPTVNLLMAGPQKRGKPTFLPKLLPSIPLVKHLPAFLTSALNACTFQSAAASRQASLSSLEIPPLP